MKCISPLTIIRCWKMYNKQNIEIIIQDYLYIFVKFDIESSTRYTLLPFLKYLDWRKKLRCHLSCATGIYRLDFHLLVYYNEIRKEVGNYGNDYSKSK